MSKKSKAVKAAPAPVAEVPPADETLEASSDEEDETGGVDEAGMKRIMELLGDDGVDEFDAAQLEALAGPSSAASASGDESEQEGGDSEDDAESNDENEEALSDEDSSDDDNEEEDEDEGEEAEDDEEQLLALDDVDDASVDEDVVPKQKVVINNKVALQRIRETIKLDSAFTWTDTLAVTYAEPLNVQDPDNDLERELAFYKQALDSANTARALAAKAKLPFTRPSDYFAEMVKSDSHMERIRQKLLDERAGIAKAEDSRRQRELKKVGKQVQVEKLKERVKGKKEMDERLKGLKRKRGGAGLEGDDDAFDVAVEDAISDKPRRGDSGPNKRGRGGDAKSRMPRSARDAKFGHGGGGKRRDKQNTRESTNDFGDAPGRGGRSGARGGRGGSRGGSRGGARGGGRGGASKRPGKDRRQSARS